MGQSDYIVAIELGSSKIAGIVGKRNSDGSIQVLSYASERSSSCIKKGVIFNIDKTAQCLTNIINRLESFLETGNTISKVYVGLSGKSLRTETNLISRNFGEETKVTQSLLDSISDENMQTKYQDMDILDFVPQEYKLENNFVDEPVGILTTTIEGRFLNVIARSYVKRNIKACFDLAKIEIADFLISPFCLADMVLSDTDKRSGCVLVDFGYDTTTVSIYKNNILRNLTVLPIGGNNITKDIAALLKIEDFEAEKLKIEYGRAVNNSLDDKDYPNEKIKMENSSREIERYFLDDIIIARAEEIVANVWNVIQNSGYDNQLFSGIVITGGASKLNGMADLVEKTCRKMNVRRVKNLWNLLPSGYSRQLEVENENDTLLSILCCGRESCCSHKDDDSVLKTGGVLFEQEDGNKKQEEKNKKEEEKEKEKEEPVVNTKPKRNGKEKKNSIFGSFVEKLFNE